jgi:hypothetical protein
MRPPLTTYPCRLFDGRGGAVMRPSSHSFTDALTSETRQAFYDQHGPAAHIMHLVLFLVPIAGYLIRGMVGVVLGMTLFMLAYYLMPYAWFALHGSGGR